MFQVGAGKFYPNLVSYYPNICQHFATFCHSSGVTSSQFIAGILDSRTQEQLAEFILMERVRLGFLSLAG